MRRVWLTLALLVPLLIALTGTEAQPAAARAEVLAPEVRFDGCGEDYYASFQPVLGQDNNHPEEQDTKPVKGAVFFDEFYNTCMVRVTDHANEPPVDFARNDYSRRQAFNADSSRFVTISYDGYWHLYDGVTLEYLKVLRGPAGDAEIQWHPTDPNLLFYLPNAGGMVIYQYDIRDDSSTIVGDFGRDDRDVPLPWPTAARVWTKSEGSPSADGRYWGFQVETSNFEPLGLMVWDRQTDEILGTWDFAEHGVGRPDHVSMSPSGEYIVPSWDGNAYGTTAFSRDFTQQVKLHHKSEHSDLALLPNGHDAYVSVDYQSNAGDVFMVEIQTGQKTVLFPTYLNGTVTALHVSGKAFDRPGWILMSTDSTQPATHWLHKKLFAVELKADPTIVNLAHTHVVSNGYWSEPQASVNRDFTRVMFNSNWDTGSDLDVDAYIVVLPNRVFQESSDVVKKFDAIPTRYLFIGNSLTGNNDGVHPHFEALMTEAGHDIAIAGEIYGGQDFESHDNRETTRAEIEQDSAEVVVLQGNRYEPIDDQEDFHTDGGLLAEAVYAADTKPLYFMTWPSTGSPSRRTGAG